MTQQRRLSAREARIVQALADAALPSVPGLPGPGREAVAAFERFLNEEPALAAALRAGLWAAELWQLPRTGLPLSALGAARRARVVERWASSRGLLERNVLRGVLAPLKAVYFEQRSVYAQFGCHEVERSAPEPEARWMSRITDGRKVEADLTLDCEVVVVGTGAGGAAAAYELARRGRAVILVEAGDHFRRHELHGRSREAFRRLYLGRGMTMALGNVAAPVWAGRAVGGTTLINSGTCYRAPEATLRRWVDEHGLTGHSPEALAPFFERVEQMLEVAPAQAAHLGGPARVIARGAERLRLSHGPLNRDAPGCDGQGVCAFGCPTGAKRSTNISYVPAACAAGAELITAANVLRIDTVAGRARGLTAKLGSGKTLTVRAEAVVVAGGALMTPLLLGRSGVCRSSGWLGKNLSIHPASRVMALFDEEIDMTRGIPQSYFVDSYAREGLMFEGGSSQPDATAVTLHWVGKPLMEVMAQYRHLASFGFMVQDTSRGRVRAGQGGLPLITYNMNGDDVAQMHKGYCVLSRIYLEAGAKLVIPSTVASAGIRNQEDLAALENTKLRPSDLEVAAFHPLGTCRMGADPHRSCVGPDNQAHDTENLYVTDGSALPSSLGANPQMTIMATALRAAELIDSRLG